MNPVDDAFLSLMEDWPTGLALESFANGVAAFADGDPEDGAAWIDRGAQCVRAIDEVREEYLGTPLHRWEDDGGAA